MKNLFWIILISLIGITVLAIASLGTNRSKIQAELIPMPEGETVQIDPAGFDRADGPRPISIPGDYGAHPDFQTEWWYYTGNLKTEAGRHFGYQLTFFRRALLPPQERQPRQSSWATDQVYLAHFAITDVQQDRHQAFERYSRGAVGLADAQSDPFQVWLKDWSVTQTADGVYRLLATEDGWSIDLVLEDIKGPVLQGDQGYSQKGPQIGDASYYISQTRLHTQGTVSTEETRFQVEGNSWMDHEFSTSALGDDQVGWDWFALQLEDGTELMLFTLRKEDGSIDAYSSGTIVFQDGSSRQLSRDDFQVEILDNWPSPESGANYPSQWKVTVPYENITLEIQPYIEDQELNLGYEYWEGAVRILGDHKGKPVTGDGYVELTGYAGSFAGEF